VCYVGDSNLDWGQDLRRLRAFVDRRQIDRIAVAYFGGSSPPYELGRRYLPWRSALGPFKGWLAISVTSWQIAQALRASHPDDAFEWLRGQLPVARIGYSILVYDLRDLQLPCPHALETLGCEAVRPERTQSRGGSGRPKLDGGSASCRDWRPSGAWEVTGPEETHSASCRPVP
jgi:hypothetical protein